jgi:1-acyl-sn-glycerol-3-phosphate acyltransferase
VKRLFRLWQCLIIASITLAYACGVMVNILIFLPLIFLSCRDAKIRRLRVRHLISLEFRLFLGCLRFCRVLLIEHPVPPPAKGPLIIVANHPSLLDIMILISIFPEADCVVKKSLWRNPFVGPMLICADYIANDDAAGFLDSAAARLSDGLPIIIFPEGSRTPPQGLRPFHRSAASVALRHACQILPVRLEFSHRVLAKGQSLFLFPPCTVSCRVEFLEKLTCTEASPGRSPALTRQLEDLFSPGSPNGTGTQRTDRQNPQP